MIVPYVKRITTGTTGTPVTTALVPQSCYVQQIVISCPGAGTAWTMRVQDKSSPDPFVLLPEFTLSVPTDGYTNVMWGGQNFIAIPMEGGIDVVTRGTTPGIVTVWAHIIQ